MKTEQTTNKLNFQSRFKRGHFSNKPAWKLYPILLPIYILHINAVPGGNVKHLPTWNCEYRIHRGIPSCNQTDLCAGSDIEKAMIKFLINHYIHSVMNSYSFHWKNHSTWYIMSKIVPILFTHKLQVTVTFSYYSLFGIYISCREIQDSLAVMSTWQLWMNESVLFL